MLLWLLSLPLSSLAQGDSLELPELQVEIWPEFDRPDALVIYRAELDPTTPVPAQVTFPLPANIQAMHAVAYRQNGSLFEIKGEAVQLTQQDDATLLTFSAPTRSIQFEYYDSTILSKQGQERQLAFSFVAPGNVASGSVQIQQPLEATNFTMAPAASSSFTDNSGFTYNRIEVAGLAPNDVFQLTATYQRSTDTPSVQLSGPAVSEHAVDIVISDEVSLDDPPALGYILVGTGALLLLGAGGYWWWSNKTANGGSSGRRRPAKRGKAGKKRASPPETAAPAQTDTATGQTVGFCYKCGTPLRADSNFCHNCGAERRQD